MKVDIYGACDKAIKAMNRENLEAFGRLKGVKWDEVHVIRTVAAVYAESNRRARKRYYEVGFEAYLLGMMLCDIDPQEAHRRAEGTITEKWVDVILSEVDPVAKYRFDAETERKAYRLAEALEVARNRNREIESALRSWSQQLGQFAINITDYALMEAYLDAGVEEVEWVSAGDQRVCGDCHSYDGKYFTSMMCRQSRISDVGALSSRRAKVISYGRKPFEIVAEKRRK